MFLRENFRSKISSNFRTIRRGACLPAAELFDLCLSTVDLFSGAAFAAAISSFVASQQCWQAPWGPCWHFSVNFRGGAGAGLFGAPDPPPDADAEEDDAEEEEEEEEQGSDVDDGISLGGTFA